MSVKWRDRPERGGRRITRFYIWLCLTVGRRGARPILYGIALYFYVFAPRERRISTAYLHRILGRRPSLFQGYLHFLTFSSVIMDRVFFLAGQTDQLDVRLHGVDAFKAMRASKRGLILASGHFGSFDAMRALGISQENLPLKVLMYMENARQLNALLKLINPDVSDSVIPLGAPGAMLEVKEWIDHDGIVGVLADRITQGDKLTRVDFLGEPADFPLGPWLLAAALDVPVVLCFAVYSGRGRYDVYFEILSDKLASGRDARMQEARRLAASYADRLAHYCRLAPYNWFNFYDFWAETEPAAGRPGETAH